MSLKYRLGQFCRPCSLNQPCRVKGSGRTCDRTRSLDLYSSRLVRRACSSFGSITIWSSQAIKALELHVHVIMNKNRGHLMFFIII